MADYISAADLTTRVGSARLGAFLGSPGSHDDILDQIIDGAEATVNGYLASRYSTPVTANALVEEWCLAVAELRLYQRGSGAEVPAKIRQAYEDAIGAMEAVVDGTITLAGATLADSSGGGIPTVSSDDPLFDADSLSEAGW